VTRDKERDVVIDEEKGGGEEEARICNALCFTGILV
jgi:hypothetical protein